MLEIERMRNADQEIIRRAPPGMRFAMANDLQRQRLEQLQQLPNYRYTGPMELTSGFPGGKKTFTWDG